jgi:hypothetical protein
MWMMTLAGSEFSLYGPDAPFTPTARVACQRSKAAPSAIVCYAQKTMSARNGDRARHHRERKRKILKRLAERALRKKLTAAKT